MKVCGGGRGEREEGVKSGKGLWKDKQEKVWAREKADPIPIFEGELIERRGTLNLLY